MFSFMSNSTISEYKRKLFFNKTQTPQKQGADFGQLTALCSPLEGSILCRLRDGEVKQDKRHKYWPTGSVDAKKIGSCLKRIARDLEYLGAKRISENERNATTSCFV